MEGGTDQGEDLLAQQTGTLKISVSGGCSAGQTAVHRLIVSRGIYFLVVGGVVRREGVAPSADFDIVAAVGGPSPYLQDVLKIPKTPLITSRQYNIISTKDMSRVMISGVLIERGMWF